MLRLRLKKKKKLEANGVLILSGGVVASVRWSDYLDNHGLFSIDRHFQISIRLIIWWMGEKYLDAYYIPVTRRSNVCGLRSSNVN